MCELAYREPQHRDVPALGKQYGLDFREAFVRTPRVRLDGVYISVCHYLRPGVTENSWYDQTRESPSFQRRSARREDVQLS